MPTKDDIGRTILNIADRIIESMPKNIVRNIERKLMRGDGNIERNIEKR